MLVFLLGKTENTRKCLAISQKGNCEIEDFSHHNNHRETTIVFKNTSGKRVWNRFHESLPLCGDIVGFDLVQLILDALLGPDLSVQGRLQLQTGRHVQLGEAPHLPRHVLEQKRINGSVTLKQEE